jgi:hypothetical protein
MARPVGNGLDRSAAFLRASFSPAGAASRPGWHGDGRRLVRPSGGRFFPLVRKESEERHAKGKGFLQSRPSLWNPILRNWEAARALTITVREPGLRPCRAIVMFTGNRGGASPRPTGTGGISHRPVGNGLDRSAKRTAFTKPPFPLESHPPKLGGCARPNDYRARSRPPAVPRNRTGSGMSVCVFDGAPVGNGLDRSAKRTGVRRAGQDPPLRRTESAGATTGTRGRGPRGRTSCGDAGRAGEKISAIFRAGATPGADSRLEG